jgi:cytochrome b
MKQILVWDLPTRLFHWLLAGSFMAAFTIANVVDDESRIFAVHMLLGAVMTLMVLLRIVWGFVGSRYARFGSFAFGPRDVIAYLKSTVSGAGTRHVGHNPGSSVAIWAMLALSLGLGVSGAFMSSNEVLEDVHEVLAYALVAVVATHVAGVAWHTLRHRENITRSMVTGLKAGESEHAIPSVHPVAALVFLALTGAWAAALVQGYEPTTQTLTLPVVGGTLQLGEGAESDDAAGGARGGHDNHRDEHVEDD